MFKHLCRFSWHIVLSALALGRYAMDTFRWGWETLRSPDDTIAMEVLVANGPRRRAIERQLRRGVRQLRHILGECPLSDVAIVVQQVIATDRQLAGCYHFGHRADGKPYGLWRLALQVNGQALSSDELLAMLTEQWLALAHQQNGSDVLVPVDLEAKEASPGRQSATLRPDPLVRHPDDIKPYRSEPGQPRSFPVEEVNHVPIPHAQEPRRAW